jgi:hypothetical protein
VNYAVYCGIVVADDAAAQRRAMPISFTLSRPSKTFGRSSFSRKFWRAHVMAMLKNGAM